VLYQSLTEAKFLTFLTRAARVGYPEQIAELVYETAADGRDQLRYVAGADAKAIYAIRLQFLDEAFRKAMARQFLSDAPKAAWLSRYGAIRISRLGSHRPAFYQRNIKGQKSGSEQSKEDRDQ
jgi:hypothetical protein